MEENIEYTLFYKWGFYFDDDDVASRWFIRVDALDTSWYAMAYYSLDDNDPHRYYETNHEELLKVLIDEIDVKLYARCVEEKNMYLQSRVEIEQMTAANFM